MSKPEDTVLVIPAPDLPPTSYVRGVPAVGKALPRAQAEALLKAGLVVLAKPEKPEPAGDMKETP